MKVCIAISYLLALAVLGDCETNGERFRRGLPPLTPTSLLVNRGEGGISKRSRRDSSPSCNPISSTHGIIQLQTASGGTFGYFGSYDGEGRNTITTNPADAMAFDLPPSLSAPFYIAISSPPEPTLEYVGAGLNSGAYFGQGDIGWTYFTASGYVPPDTSESGQSYDGGPAETTIWSISCNLQLSAIWTNIDTTQYPGTFFYEQKNNLVGMAGDFHLTALYLSSSSDTITEVSLYFVPQ